MQHIGDWIYEMYKPKDFDKVLEQMNKDTRFIWLYSEVNTPDIIFNTFINR